MYLVYIAAMAAVFSWAMAKEEVSKEYREWYSATKGSLASIPKYFGYIPTCEYCFSFWFLLLLCMLFTPKVVYPDWRGYVLAHGVCWALCVTMMTLYQLLRVIIRRISEGFE